MTVVVNKSGIVDQIANTLGCTKAEAQRHLDAFFSAIEDNLKDNKETRLPGFATFKVQHRAARKGRNPQTGAELQIPASKTCNIKAGSALKEAASES